MVFLSFYAYMRNILFAIAVASITLFCSTSPALATGDDYTLSGATTTYAQTGITLEITDVQITQIAGDASSSVPVKLQVSNGTLSLATTTGLTFTGGTTGALLQFEGTLSNVNAALSTISYTRASTGSDTLEITLADPGEVFFEENGHLYEFVTTAPITWNNAFTAAAGFTKYGATGYLTTITSEAENDFVSARLDGAGWMAASDASVEGQWLWVAGPENGTQFWQGVGGAGSTVGGGYENWNTGEPNDHGSGEDCGQFLDNGLWNDLPCGTTLTGYVVEYGAPGDLPSVAARNISITTINAPTVSSLSPVDNGTDIATSTDLTIVFNTPVSPASGTVNIFTTIGNTLFESIDVTSEQVSGSNTTTITISPSTDFEDETEYYVLVSSTAFAAYTDTSIYFAGIDSPTTWSFTTIDETPPSIAYLYPADNATTVATNASIQIGFTEPVVTSTGFIYLKSGTTTIESFSVATSSRITQEDPELFIIDPTDRLAEETSYYLTIDTGTFVDETGNPFAGIADATRWNFVTADETAPSFVTGTPATGATNVPIDTTFVYTFDEVVDVVSSTEEWLEWSEVYSLIIINEAGDTILYSVAATATEQIAGVGTDTLTFTLSEPLEYSTTYIHAIALDVYDASGNRRFVNNFTDTQQRFTTEDDPVEAPESRGGGNPIPAVLPHAPGFSGGSMLSRSNTGLSPRLTADETLENNADERVVTGMALSLDDPTFTGASIIPYSRTYDIDIPADGQEHIIYIRYFSVTGHRSEDFSIVIPGTRETQQPTIPATPTEVVPTPPPTEQRAFTTPLAFSRSLERGMRGEDVRLLQQVLNHLGFTVDTTGVGSPGQESDYFGQLTYDAVLRFQASYAEQILAPLGLTAPTGYVGPSTIAQLRLLLE